MAYNDLTYQFVLLGTDMSFTAKWRAYMRVLDVGTGEFRPEEAASHATRRGGGVTYRLKVELA